LHNDLGVALLHAGDREGAREAFRRAAELGYSRAHSEVQPVEAVSRG
jgi:Flp pilus assembly protein TadD